MRTRSITTNSRREFTIPSQNKKKYLHETVLMISHRIALKLKAEFIVIRQVVI